MNDAPPLARVPGARPRRRPRGVHGVAGAGRSPPARPVAGDGWLDRAADDAILTNGAGNYSTWCTALRYRAFAPSSRPTSGAMATACRPRLPPRPSTARVVVSWNGDGCFLMNGQELATAVQYGLAVVFVVVDNGCTAPSACIRSAPIPGRSRLGARQSGFRRARAGLRRARRNVTSTAEFAPAFERAPRRGRPALLHSRSIRRR